MLKVVATFSFLAAATTPLSQGNRVPVMPRGFDFPLVGTPMPSGRGSAAQGFKVFADKCSMCHTPPQRMLRQQGIIGTSMAECWRYPKPLFNFVKIAMPNNNARGTLTDSEVYAVVAYLLWDADLIKMGDIMNAQSLPRVKMPHERGFILSGCPLLSHFQ